MSSGKVLIYGGRGALGASCVSLFKLNNFWVGSIDLTENEHADLSIVIPKECDWEEQESHVIDKVGSVLNGSKLDAVICVAGGWIGGNAQKDLSRNANLMWKQSVWTSSISAALSALYLKDGGLLALTGAKPALKGTPGMIGYGMAKAAVHQLTKSLAEEESGLPKDSLVVAILPITLDTQMNRKWMPNADFNSWTPLSYVSELFLSWTKNEKRPSNGSLLQLVTKDSNTTVVASE